MPNVRAARTFESLDEEPIPWPASRIPRRRTARIDRRRTEIAEFLAPFGIWYEKLGRRRARRPRRHQRGDPGRYAPEIERLKQRGGYVTADVINVTPETPNLDAMLAKFSKEHTHSEDEVRFTVKGSGVFHIHPDERPGVRHPGRIGRPDQRPRRHAALVRPVQRPHDPLHPPVPGHSRAGRRTTSTAASTSSYAPVCWGRITSPRK